MLSCEKTLVKPMVPGYIFHHTCFQSILFCNLYFQSISKKIPKIFILLLSSLSDISLASGREGIDNPFIALVARFLFVCVGTRWVARGLTKKNTLPWWYVFVTVGHVFCHACTSMTILCKNQNSHTCAVVEVFHDITKIIITKVFTSMMINAASWKCFRQGWLTHGIHHNGSPLSYRVRFWIR